MAFLLTNDTYTAPVWPIGHEVLSMRVFPTQGCGEPVLGCGDGRYYDKRDTHVKN